MKTTHLSLSLIAVFAAACAMGEMRAEGDAPSEWPLDRRVDVRLLPE